MIAMFRALLVALILITGAAQPASAGAFEDGLAAYRTGNYPTALRLWMPLARQGYAGAQYNLGLMYANGQGVPQNYAEAVKWYRLAADQGYADAQINLGFMYDNGQGVPQNYAEAVKWYRLAADQGNAPAQYNLGLRYAKGEGVPQNFLLAHMWFNLASAGGAADGGKNRDFVASKMTPAQIAEAQRLAAEWKPK